jgi:hypothetical protein
MRRHIFVIIPDPLNNIPDRLNAIPNLKPEFGILQRSFGIISQSELRHNLIFAAIEN